MPSSTIFILTVYINRMADSFSFFHFGCWNVDGCVGENSKTKRIVDRIKKNGYNFGIIAGDNIYPTKIQGKKKEKLRTDLNILSNGIDYLVNTDIKIYPVLGNHDVESIRNIGQEKYISDDDQIIADCEHFYLQLKKWMPMGNMYDWEFGNSHFVAIDTNIMEVLSGEESAISAIEQHPNLNGCSQKTKKHIINQLDRYRNFNYHDAKMSYELCDGIDGMTDKLDIDLMVVIRRNQCYAKAGDNMKINIAETKKFFNTVLEKISNKNKIFIIGHEPIFSFKHKKKTAYCDNVDKFSFLIDHFLNKINQTVKIYYLCADTHNYQHIILDITHRGKKYTIDQIVAGTGGGVPDGIPSIDDNDQNLYTKHQLNDYLSVTPVMIDTSYGYADIKVSDNHVDIQYIKTGMRNTTNLEKRSEADFKIDKTLNLIVPPDGH